jgi:hypothetical protein
MLQRECFGSGAAMLADLHSLKLIYLFGSVYLGIVWFSGGRALRASSLRNFVFANLKRYTD